MPSSRSVLTLQPEIPGEHKLALRPEKQPRQGSWDKGQANWR